MQNEEQSNELKEIRVEGKLSKSKREIRQHHTETEQQTTNNVFDFNDSTEIRTKV